MKSLYSVAQLAEMAAMSRWAVDRMLKRNDIKCIWVGSKRLIPLSELVEKLPELMLSDRYAKLFERLAEAEAGGAKVQRASRSVTCGLVASKV